MHVLLFTSGNHSKAQKSCTDVGGVWHRMPKSLHMDQHNTIHEELIDAHIHLVWSW